MNVDENHMCPNCGHTEEHCEKSQKLLYKEALKIVTETGKASASFLQRKMNIGYAKAARLIDTMEDQGVIGPFDSRTLSRKVIAADKDDIRCPRCRSTNTAPIVWGLYDPEAYDDPDVVSGKIHMGGCLVDDELSRHCNDCDEDY